MTNLPVFFQNFGKSLANPFVSKNGPLRQLIAAQNWTNVGGYHDLSRGPGMLRKMGHFNSRLASEMRSLQKSRISQDFPKFGEIRVDPFQRSKCGRVRNVKFPMMSPKFRGVLADPFVPHIKNNVFATPSPTLPSVSDNSAFGLVARMSYSVHRKVIEIVPLREIKTN